uniref:uncharacterized protein n=1 Tax=Myxine glutinosa TaxID=7769 RepID=UPI00358E27E8
MQMLHCRVQCSRGPTGLPWPRHAPSGTSRIAALWQQTASTLRWGGGWLSPTRRGGTPPMTVVVLNTILETKRPALHRVMTQLKVNSFNDHDVDLMKEYAKVMSHVVKALDKIQGEDQAYLGTLLPTVAATVFRLKDLKSKGLVYCSPLVDALLAGIDKRFGLLLEDEECQLAAAFHPRFRLIWLEKYDNTKVAKVMESMEGKVEEVMRQESNEVGSNSGGSNEEDDFFSAVTQLKESSRSHTSLKSKAKNLVKTWLETNSKDLLTDAAFLGEQVLVDLFIKFNTAIPSSAAVERLFSMGKDILRAKRSSLSDENFGMLMFMKGNEHLMDKMENEKKRKN